MLSGGRGLSEVYRLLQTRTSFRFETETASARSGIDFGMEIDFGYGRRDASLPLLVLQRSSPEGRGQQLRRPYRPESQ